MISVADERHGGVAIRSGYGTEHTCWSMKVDDENTITARAYESDVCSLVVGCSLH